MSWKQINSELYRNDNGQAMMLRPDKDGKPTPFFIDDSNPDLAIPVVDFMENPFYKYTTSWKELKALLDTLRIDLSFLYQNSSALFIEVVASSYIPIFFPINLSGVVANSTKLHKVGRCHGLASDNTLVGTAGRFQCTGTIQNTAWSFIPGENVFLNGYNLTHSIPTTGFVQKLGTAKNNNTLVLNIGEPITL